MTFCVALPSWFRKLFNNLIQTPNRKYFHSLISRDKWNNISEAFSFFCKKLMMSLMSHLSRAQGAVCPTVFKATFPDLFVLNYWLREVFVFIRLIRLFLWIRASIKRNWCYWHTNSVLNYLGLWCFSYLPFLDMWSILVVRDMETFEQRDLLCVILFVFQFCFRIIKGIWKEKAGPRAVNMVACGALRGLLTRGWHDLLIPRLQ